MRIRLRKAKTEDVLTIAELFRGTVMTVNAMDYSIEEVKDWATRSDDFQHWKELVEQLYFVIAEEIVGKSNRAVPDIRTGQEQMVGFASISEEGYLHSMYVHKGYQRCGIATALLQTVESYARERGVKKISSEVSITAQPFFENRGYQVVAKQKKKAKELKLRNFVMELSL